MCFPNTCDSVFERLCETHLRGAGYTLSSLNMAKIGKQCRSLQIIADLEICFKCPKLRALDKTDTSASRFECAWLDRSSFQQSNPQTLGLSRKRLFLRKAAENGIHPEMISVRTKWKQHFDTCKTSSTLLSSFSWKVFDSNPHKISFIWFEAATVSLWVSTKMVLHPAINRAFGSLGNPDDDQPLIERWSTLIQSSLISQGRVHGEPGFICRPSVPVQPLRQGENDDWNFTLLNRLPLFVYLCLPSFTFTQMYRKIRIGKKTARLGYVRNVALLPEFFSDTGTTVVPLWYHCGKSLAGHVPAAPNCIDMTSSFEIDMSHVVLTSKMQVQHTDEEALYASAWR